MGQGGSNRPLELRTETVRPEGPQDGVTIKNDTRTDALLYFANSAWGSVSLGYVRSGKSVNLPTSVNVDAWAHFEGDSGVFLRWPGPHVTYSRKKTNLTPGQSYSLSDFD